MEKLKNTLNDLSLTNEEVNRLSEAFKKEEFRKLFREYAEELQDPENRRKYEEELTAMENERGMDVDFINPLPGHVLKTIQNSEKKVFINICQSDKIEKPSVTKTTKGDMRGANWSIPHSFSQPREDVDKKNDSCLVYDVVFNVNAYQMGTKNPRYRKMLHDTALEGIEKMFKVNLDKINYKILKLKMKGVPVATVIRKKRSDFDDKQTELKTRENDPLNFPYPEIKETTKTEYKVNEEKKHDKSDEFTKPNYKIKYSNDFEMMNYVGEEIKHSIRPKRMIIEIKLPLISSANSVDLDIDSRTLKLTSVKPVKYLLELKLSYPVLSDLGSAKFDKSTKTLKLDLPVEQIPEKLDSMNENLTNISNNLIEEHPLELSEINKETNSQISTEMNVANLSSDIPGNIEENESEFHEESLPCNIDQYSDIKHEEFNEIERIVPDIDLKFRNNSKLGFFVCNIKNVEKSSLRFLWNSISTTQQEVIISFSNCGQGGWKNLYKLPLTIDFKGEINSINNDLECFVSNENLVIQLPLLINSQFIQSITFRNQIFQCNYENPVYFTDELWKLDTSHGIENDHETFQSVYGMVNKETLKIICAPIEFTIDLEKEFPKIDENILSDNYDDETIHLEQKTMEINIENEDKTNIVEIKEMNENQNEITKDLLDSMEKKSSEKTKDISSSILCSDYFEEKRSLEHRTDCPVELTSDLLFDLE